MSDIYGAGNSLDQRPSTIAEAIQLLHRSSRPLIGILSDDVRVKGIITYENLAEYMPVVEAGSNWTFQKQRAGGL